MISRKTSRTLALLLAGIGLGFNTYSQSYLTDGLVAYYPFDGNANDQSGYANHGTNMGAVLTADRFGAGSRAMSFNGVNQYIKAPNQSYLNFPGGDFTISFWVSLADTNKTQYIVGKDMAVGTMAKWVVNYGVPPGRTTPAGLSFHITDPASAEGWYAPSDAKLTANVWQQVLVRKASTRYDFYVNGALISTGTGPAALPQNNTAALTIGEAENGGFVNGKLDDVRLYSRALSPFEIQQLYEYECQPHPCTAHAATATAQVVNGFVVGITLTDAGCGYTEDPKVEISGGGGSGATATATVADGLVSKITVTSAGIGYTNTPIVLIGSPVFPPWLETAVSKVKVMQHVVLGERYVLLSSVDLKSWTQEGTPFTAQSDVVAQEFNVDQVGRFFRLQQLP